MRNASKESITTRTVELVLVGLALACCVQPSKAQEPPPVGPPHCVSGCQSGSDSRPVYHPRPRSSGNGSSDSSPERRRLDRAYDLNQRGNQAYQNGDWNTAVNLYTEALKLSPNDRVIRENLENAKSALGVAEEKRAVQDAESTMKQQENNVAPTMANMVEKFADSQTSRAAGDDLMSARYHSVSASQLAKAGSLEAAKKEASQTFDTDGGNHGSLQSIASSLSDPLKPPEVAPTLRTNPEFQELQSKWTVLRGQYSLMQGQLKYVESQINSGAGNKAQLEARAATIKQEMSSATDQMVYTKYKILDLSLHIPTEPNPKSNQ
jgi:hypothetical protein